MAPRKSLVWKYSTPSEDGKSITCGICHSTLSFNGSTSVIMKHLRGKHREAFSSTSSELVIDVDEPSTSGPGPSHEINEGSSCTKQQKIVTPCTSRRQEQISQALVRMISANMMPISFGDSKGFKEFMAILEPGYQCPCPKTTMKRLQLTYNEKRSKIEKELSMASDIAITNDGWSSRSQDSYISTTAHFISEKWIIKNYTLCTQFMEDRHSGENLAIMFNLINQDWNINNKVNAMVHDNASNISMAANLADNVRYSISCAAHNIQLCVKDALDTVDEFKEVIKKGSKIVQYFKHSNIATSALTEKQEQLNLSKQKLIQSCPTRWNSYYYMCERLVNHRDAIVSVLADKLITKVNIALKLEMSGYYWLIMSDIITVLKPLQVATTALCSENTVTISMVLPIIHGIVNNHLTVNNTGRAETEQFKNVLVTSFVNRFNLHSHGETIHRFTSFLDLRNKQMSFEINYMKKIITISTGNMIENIP